MVSSKAPSPSRDSHRRSVMKAISWRIVGTIDTMLWAWIITGKLRVSLMIGSAEAVSKIALFYLHERAWAAVPVGGITGLLRNVVSKEKTPNVATSAGP